MSPDCQEPGLKLVGGWMTSFTESESFPRRDAARALHACGWRVSRLCPAEGSRAAFLSHCPCGLSNCWLACVALLSLGNVPSSEEWKGFCGDGTWSPGHHQMTVLITKLGYTPHIYQGVRRLPMAQVSSHVGPPGREDRCVNESFF